MPYDKLNFTAVGWSTQITKCKVNEQDKKEQAFRLQKVTKKSKVYTAASKDTNTSARWMDDQMV